MQKVSRQRALEIAEACECEQMVENGCPVDCCKNCGLYDGCVDVCEDFLTPVYTGSRKTMGDMAGEAVVKNEGHIFSPQPSISVDNHSPDGFNWGYGGSGPAQLALALLLDFTGDPEVALKYHQDFKWQVVAHFGDTWHITGEEINLWLKKQGAPPDATY